MSDQVKSLVRSVPYHTRNISRIRRHFTIHSTKKLVNSLVTLHLDYCNSLLVGVADGLLQHLQCAQDWAARTVLQLPRSVEAPLHELHWLPVSSRIDYKLAVTAFRAKHGLAPDYINELALPHSVSRTLRSTGTNLLHVPKSNIVKGDRAFMIDGPKVWNSVPSNIRTITNLVDFEKKLKTFFYSKAFM